MIQPVKFIKASKTNGFISVSKGGRCIHRLGYQNGKDFLRELRVWSAPESCFFLSIQQFPVDCHLVSNPILLPYSKEIFEQIIVYRDRYSGNLPVQAVEVINRFEYSLSTRFLTDKSRGDMDSVKEMRIRFTGLAALRSELEFHLSNSENLIRTATERAFLHLQRCIVADADFRERWKSAFDKNEPACEKLGAVHLLWHGIWAFKVSTEGERTDLVMGDRVDNPTQISEVSIGLVLTEWKCAKSDLDVQKKHEEARRQASRYAEGALGGIELTTLRYLVVVTNKLYPLQIEDKLEGGVVYRFKNIAVNPSTPSKDARIQS